MKSNLKRTQDGLELPQSNPLVIVISGPSGVGKDAILNRMKERKCPFEFITTMTTRSRRANEKSQIDYNFVTLDEFNELINNNGLLEYAKVYGNYYGVPRQPVKEALDKGKDTIIKVDVQGAATIRKIIPEAVSIFIAPPSMNELSNRLIGRCTENASDLEMRISISKNELQQVCEFDYVVINASNQIDIAIDEINAIITAEKRRASPRKINL
jgi:guanylate kinase